jgi:hypothetical protein
MTIFSDALTDILHDSALSTTATIGSASVTGVFSNSFLLVDGIETKAPTFEALDEDLTAVAHGTAITIDSVAYTVIGIQPNGEGSTLLILRKTT